MRRPLVWALSTVGYGEVHRMSPEGRLFSIFLILFGLGLVFSTIGAFTSLVIEGSWVELMNGRKMDRTLNRMEGHTIVCGYGRVGEWAAREL